MFLPFINEKHGLLPAKSADPVAMLRCQLSYDWTISLQANADATGGRRISSAPSGEAVNFYSISSLSVWQLTLQMAHSLTDSWLHHRLT